MKYRVILILLIIIQGLISKELKLHIYPGGEWNHSFKMGLMTIHTTPQFAVWLEDSSGNYLATLNVTLRSAKSKYRGAKESRPSALPIWAHKRAVLSEYNNFMPSKNLQLPDAITSASPLSDTTLLIYIPDSLIENVEILYFEINQSMDFNEYYSEGALPNTPNFSNSVNGQPSLLYKCVIYNNMSHQSMSLQGCGDPTGGTGNLNTELSNITTALSIIDSLVVEE